MPERFRVLLADNHPLLREGLRHRLQTSDSLTLVGETADGHAVQHLCHRLQPDVLLLAFNLPGPSPLETVTGVRTSCPNTKTVILSAYADVIPIRTLLDLGVRGYVLKSEAPQVVIQAIQAAAQGGTWFSQAVMQQLTQEQTEAWQIENFTDKEKDVLHLLVRGWSNDQIAQALSISDRAVRNRMQAIRDKLNMTRSEVIAWAVRAGYGNE